MLERNEMRNKALGIASNQSSLVEEKEKSFDKENRKLVNNTRKSISSPRKSAQNNEIARIGSKTPVKTISSKSEDADVAVEINITSTQNIQVSFMFHILLLCKLHLGKKKKYFFFFVKFINRLKSRSLNASMTRMER